MSPSVLFWLTAFIGLAVATFSAAMTLTIIAIGVNIGIIENQVAKLLVGCMVRGIRRNIGIMTGKRAGIVTECASLASLQVDPSAAQTDPSIIRPSNI